MAAGATARILRGPGRVIVNPSSSFNGGTYPYGGTEVGRTNLCAIASAGEVFQVEYESLGEAGDILEADNHYTFSCFLRGWDDDAVRLFFAGGYELGSVSQHSTFFVPGSRTPGQSATSRGILVAFVPDDLEHVPGVVVYNGIPDWTDGAEMAFQRREEIGIPITLRCLRNGSGSILRIGRLADLPLT